MGLGLRLRFIFSHSQDPQLRDPGRLRGQYLKVGKVPPLTMAARTAMTIQPRSGLT